MLAICMHTHMCAHTHTYTHTTRAIRIRGRQADEPEAWGARSESSPAELTGRNACSQRSADAGVRKERKGTARAADGKVDWILFDVFQLTQVQD